MSKLSYILPIKKVDKNMDFTLKLLHLHAISVKKSTVFYRKKKKIIKFIFKK